MWGADGMIYFASERDGTFNIWRIAPKGGAAQQVTRHKDDGVQFPAISPDGKRIIYENEFDLWTLDVPNGTPRKVTIAMTSDAKENDVDVISADSRADGFSPSPNGDYLAVDFHGEIVIVPTEQGVGEKTQVTSSPWRERFQAYSPDGRKIAYVSDESGEEEVWVCDMATAREAQADDARVGEGRPHVGAELAEARVHRGEPALRGGRGRRRRRASSRTIPPAASRSSSTPPTATGSSTRIATTIRTPTSTSSTCARERSTTSRRARSTS